MTGVIDGELDLQTAIGKMPPVAKEFLQSNFKFAAAAGGWRSGKTVALCVWGIILGRRIPNSLFLFGRFARPALDDTTRRTFLELCPRDWVAPGGWKETTNRLIMRNGTEYLFRHLDLGDADVQGHIRGLNLTGFGIDQSEECDEKAYLTLEGRLSRKTSPIAHFGRVCLNPAGHDWNWERFFREDRPDGYKRLYKGYVLPTAENESNLPDGYVQDLIDTYPTDWTDRFVYASFSDFTDMVYPEFDSRLHVYDGNKEWTVFNGRPDPPEDWPTYHGVDFGGTDPWAWEYAARDPQTGNVFIFDEIYEANTLMAPLVERHKGIMRGRRECGMAYDYENKQAALELSNHGVSGSPAVKDVRPGVFRVATYLHPDPRIDHAFTGNKPGPRLYISSKCQNLIRELTTYKYGKDRAGKSTGLPKDGNDHAPDALRYLLLTLLPLPPSPKEIEKDRYEGIDLRSRLYWQQIEEYEKRRNQPRRPRFYARPPYAGSTPAHRASITSSH